MSLQVVLSLAPIFPWLYTESQSIHYQIHPDLTPTPMPGQRHPLQPITKLALALWGTTLVFWVLRGLAILTFIPGLMFWLLILAGFALGVIASLQRIR